MVTNLLRKVIGTRNDRLLRRMGKVVAKINGLEAQTQALDDAALRAKTDEFRERLQKGETLDDLLPEAFTVVREVAQRALEMRHFDVQLIGGMVLHQGRIAEMRTGEGKTLVATLAVYLNALTGRGVHVVTVNDYLARRDAEWMGQIYERLGMRTGVVVPGMSHVEKREAYAADITYGTNNEFGFDYLRDNMAFSDEEKMQRELHFAIVDEVDSILIDEARTPLIISGPAEDSSELYAKVDRLIPRLTRQQEEDGPGDYSVDEKARQVYLTEAGHERVEEMMEEVGLLGSGQSLYDAANIALMHHVNAALRAHALFQRDVHYLVRDGEVVIVDEFTGRTMPGRRWSEGLHQAVEAKERVSIQQENQTLAAITFQNYFRLYKKLAGMTGTADTEAAEFQEIYGLEVVVIPTHMPMIRDDRPDLVYLSKEEKFDAILEDIRDCRERGQPALVGTTSVETSEFLSRLLDKEKIPHQVLNAKQHALEAEVVAQAGRPGTVTIATNMAGRGTDIVLGGNLQAELANLEAARSASDDGGQQELWPEREQTFEKARLDWQGRHGQVLAAGGLHIIGTERHESRRVDNQLRGRSGRQGDVGSSRFYLSLEDDLMRIFASDRVSAIMQKLGMEQGEAIEHPWVTKAIANAQKKVEGRNFDIRKQLLEYDNVANDQRREIYALRNEVMGEIDVAERVQAIRADVVEETVDSFIPPQSLEEQWDVPGLQDAIEATFGQRLDIAEWLESDESLHEETLRERVLEAVEKTYAEKEEHVGAEILRDAEKQIMLRVLDVAWKEHLAAMDHLRQGIHLRSFAQKNPKQEYKREAFEMFNGLLGRLKHEVTSILSKVQLLSPEDVAALEAQRRRTAPMQFLHPGMAPPTPSPEPEGPEGMPASPPEPPAKAAPYVRGTRKIGRNEPCPCGSGKKYKQCHGRLN